MKEEATILARDEGPVSWITLNRPERLNAFRGDMRDRLADAVETAARRPGTRVIVLTGAGRGFCAGADVDAMADLVAGGDSRSFSSLVQAAMRVVRRIREAPQPVVAAVNGVAAGGGAGLAAACDLRIAAASASIGFTFGRIGLHPDWGTTYFLPRLIGLGRAEELIFTGRIIDSQEAERIGLFERVVPDERFEEAVRELAQLLATRSPLAMTLAKQTLTGSDALPAIEESLRQEAEAQMRCFRSEDVAEGLAAFRQKRAPRFGDAVPRAPGGAGGTP
jgi:2-(1,2-epoxy-1,2-dihydrophenyl)acetyl-CoA isomerase